MRNTARGFVLFACVLVLACEPIDTRTLNGGSAEGGGGASGTPGSGDGASKAGMPPALGGSGGAEPPSPEGLSGSAGMGATPPSETDNPGAGEEPECTGDDRDNDGIPESCDLCLVGDDAADEDTDGVPNACDCDFPICSPEQVCEPRPTGVECSCDSSNPTCDEQPVTCAALTPPEGMLVDDAEKAPGETVHFTCEDAGFVVVGATERVCLGDGTWSGENPQGCELADCGPPPAVLNGAVSAAATTYSALATYSCSPGHTTTDALTLTCGGDARWSAGAPSCNPVDCGSPPAAPSSGSVRTDKTTFGGVATYSCLDGFGITGSAKLSCTADGSWSGAAPTCVRSSCGSPPSLTNGKVSIAGETSGSTATYSCNSGYTLSGTALITCQNDGAWSGGAPSCSPVSCGAPSNPSNGAASFTSTTLGSTATYSCDAGYSLSTSATRTCQPSGAWSGANPSCNIISCGNAPALTNGALQTITSTSYGGIATYTCNAGYSLSGSATRTCQANGSWSGHPSCSTVSCGTAPSVSNGSRTTTGSNFGDTASYSCNTGYTLSGTATSTCQSSATWSGSRSCTVVDCGTPPSIANGTRSWTGTEFGATATYSCSSGYNRSGSASRSCQSNGSWSGSNPTCTIVDCGTPPTITNGSRTFSSTTFGSSAAYTCAANYTLSGNSSRACQANGSWSGSNSCVKTTFSNPSAVNQFGTTQRIWGDAKTTNNNSPRTVNADHFCNDQGLGLALDNLTTSACVGEDESSYVDWSTSQGRWVGRSSGSSNSACYELLTSVTCGL